MCMSLIMEMYNTYDKILDLLLYVNYKSDLKLIIKIFTIF